MTTSYAGLGPVSFLLVAACLALGTPTLAAQGLDGYQLTGTSTLAVLDEAEGYGGGFSAPLASWLWVRVAVSTRRSEGAFDGAACEGLSCEETTLRMDTNFDELAFSLMPSLVLWDRLRFSVGPSFAVSQVRADVVADNGLDPRVFVPGSGHPGYGATAEVVLQPFLVVPLALKAGWSWRRFDLDGCAAPTTRARPFCADAEATEIRLGGAIMLGGS